MDTDGANFIGWPSMQKSVENYMRDLNPSDFNDPPEPWRKKPDIEPNLLSQIGSVATWGAAGLAVGTLIGVATVAIPAVAAAACVAAAAITGTSVTSSVLAGAAVPVAATVGAGAFASIRFLTSRKTRGLRYTTLGAAAGLLAGLTFGAPLICAGFGFLAVACAYDDHRQNNNLAAKGQAKKEGWDAYLCAAGGEYLGSILRPNTEYAKRHAEMQEARKTAMRRKHDRLLRQLSLALKCGF